MKKWSNHTDNILNASRMHNSHTPHLLPLADSPPLGCMRFMTTLNCGAEWYVCFATVCHSDSFDFRCVLHSFCMGVATALFRNQISIGLIFFSHTEPGADQPRGAAHGRAPRRRTSKDQVRGILNYAKN